MATTKDVTMEPTVCSLNDDLVCIYSINNFLLRNKNRNDCPHLIFWSIFFLILKQNEAAKEFEEQHKQDLEKVKELDRS